MDLKGKKIGVALTGSFCTFEKIFKEMEKLAQLGADIYPLFSNASQSIETVSYTHLDVYKRQRMNCS